jgi:ribosomal-protein-alanine N-acetyltransferase
MGFNEMKTLAFPVDFPLLETKRLVLRELRQTDAQAVFRNYSERTAVYFIYEPFSHLQQAMDLINTFADEFRRRKTIMWAIALKETDTCIGTCGYMFKSNAKVEIGYDLAGDHWGKGLMSEALRAILTYGFDRLGIRKINADTLSSNSRSINLLKRLGFELDNVGKNSHFFSLRKKDWERDFGSS